MLRLDAASPEPAPVRARSARPALGRRRRIVLLAVAAILLTGAVGAAAQPGDDRPAEIAAQARDHVETPNRLNAVLAPLFPADECVSLDEGMRRTRKALDESGFQAWQILWDGDLVDGGCTIFAFSLRNVPEAVELVPRNP